MTEPRAPRSIRGLLHRFLRPYSRWLASVVVLNVAIGFGFTLRPLVLAPALDAFTGSQGQPATGLSDLTLNNVGPTLAALLHLDPADPIKMGLHAAGLFLLITVVVALLSLGSQILLAHTQLLVQHDMLVALHAHLLALPLGYFHKHRAGELVSRLTIDARKRVGRPGRHRPPDPPVHGSGRPHARRDVPHRPALHGRHPDDGIGPPAGDARPQEPRLPRLPARGRPPRRSRRPAPRDVRRHPGHQVLRRRASRVPPGSRRSPKPIAGRPGGPASSARSTSPSGWWPTHSWRPSSSSSPSTR